MLVLFNLSHVAYLVIQFYWCLRLKVIVTFLLLHSQLIARLLFYLWVYTPFKIWGYNMYCITLPNKNTTYTVVTIFKLQTCL